MKNSIILEGVKSTEKIVRQIETNNVLVFVVPRSARKQEIKREVEELFSVKVQKVRTFIKNNKKYAYVKLNPEFEAADVATKLGVI